MNCPENLTLSTNSVKASPKQIITILLNTLFLYGINSLDLNSFTCILIIIITEVLPLYFVMLSMFTPQL